MVRHPMVPAVPTQNPSSFQVCFVKWLNPNAAPKAPMMQHAYQRISGMCDGQSARLKV